MPDSTCATCRIRPEAEPGVRMCRPCLEIAEIVLRAVRSKEITTTLPVHVTPTHLRDWAGRTVLDMAGASLVAHVLRGLIQGVLLAEEQVIDTPQFGGVAYLSVVAMQAMQEVDG